MKHPAAVLEGFGEALRLCQYPAPAAIEPGAAWVAVEMAGICGTDVHLWQGQLPISLPVILGHETVGRVLELGEGLERDWLGQPLAVGDRVTWNSATSCGACFYCRKGEPTRCPARRAYGIGYRCDQAPHFFGGYAERHYLNPGVTLFKLAPDLPTEAVIGAGCALITAIHGIERVSRPGIYDQNIALPVLPDNFRDHVVVQGAGPVGIAAVAVARHAGARRVLVIGGPAHRLELARRFGADEVIDLEAGDRGRRISQVREWTGGHGADLVLECAGVPAAVPEAIELCRDGARLLVLGHYCDAGTIAFNPHWVTRKQLQIVGSWSSEPRHLAAALELLRAEHRRFPFADLITHRFALADANRALQTTARLESAKSVIVPHAPESVPP